MKCPCCGNEMESGIVQSARTVFFTTKEHKNWFFIHNYLILPIYYNCGHIRRFAIFFDW